ncbi:MAG: TolC family protein [Planctomycetes bacterium]|nr:TolC family protein [Planctomycetota bacterium]
MLSLAVVGCGAAHYREQADRDAYAIVAEKQVVALGQSGPFSIDPPLESLREELEVADLVAPTSQPPAPLVLNLEQCLDAGAENNRDLIRQKQIVFLSALAVSLARFEFEDHYFGMVSATAERVQQTLKPNFGNIPASDIRLSPDVPASDNSGTHVETGVTHAFSTGLRALLSVGNDFLRAIPFVISRNRFRRREHVSFINLVLNQPLLRGAGAAVIREPLVQAERDCVYAVRDYERFRQNLAVKITAAVYRLQQQRDQVQNEQQSLDRLTLSRKRSEILAAAGRLPRFEVDQAKQDELRAKNRLIVAKETYDSLLDDLKLLLGLPTDAPIELSEGDIQRLLSKGFDEVAVEAPDAVTVALRERLDLQVARDKADDARRKIVVAEDALQAGIDIVFTARAGTKGHTTTKVQLNDTNWTGQLKIDLPFNRMVERNAYRASLVGLDQREREADQTKDAIKQEVREAIRRLEETRVQFDIQNSAVKLAQIRIRSTNMLLEAGRATTRDVLDAQSALVDAQNALSRALVEHTIAKLELLRDSGTLHVQSGGLRYDDSLAALIPPRP